MQPLMRNKADSLQSLGDPKAITPASPHPPELTLPISLRTMLCMYWWGDAKMIKSASFTTSVRSADAVTFSPSFTPATITETHSYEMAHCCGDILSQLHPCNNHQDTQLSNGTLLQ